MKKINLLLFLTIIISLNGFSQCPDTWAIRAGSDSREIARKIVTDNNGNIYIAGYFEDHTLLDTIELNGYGNNMFLAKYDATGNIQWAQYGGGDYVGAEGLAIGANNNIYVTGFFRDTAYFGSSTITSSGLSDVFLANYSPEGDLLWIVTIGGIGQDGAYGVTTDEDGNTYVSTHNSLSKYNTHGTPIWVRQFDGMGMIKIHSDYNGYLNIMSTFSGTIDLGSITLTSRGWWDILVAKLDTTGNVVWAKQVKGGNNYDTWGEDITTDRDGNMFVTGRFQDTVFFETDTLIGVLDIFIAKYNAAGDLLWVKQSQGNTWGLGRGITTDIEGNAYITGEYNGSPYFDSIILPETYSGFVIKYNASGSIEWVEKLVRGDNDITSSINGDILVAGTFIDTSAFGTTELISAGNSDIFIWNVCKASSTNIEENPLIVSNYKIHPNPVINKLYIVHADVKENLNVKIYNALGQVVHAAAVQDSNGRYMVDMDNYPKGLYVIQLLDKTGLNAFKIIK